MTSVADDEKLTEALLQIEQLHKELGDQKSSSGIKVNSLIDN